MIGLSFLAVGLLWFALSLFIAIKLPRWIGIKREELRWVLSGVLLLVFMVGPFVDHMVGMRQFEKLCREQTMPRISPSANAVEWATRFHSNAHQLPRFWIDVEAETILYTDDASKTVFLEYEYYTTKGGRIVALASMGGWYSCSAPQNEKYRAQFKTIPAYQKIVHGVQK